MGLYSGWEEEYDRKQYLKDERLAMLEEEQRGLADLFRECTPDDPCGACPGCCQHEQGGEA